MSLGVFPRGILEKENYGIIRNEQHFQILLRG